MGNSSYELTIGTWNIGGGILGESHQIDGDEELDYYCDRARQWGPDILCLQEAHEFGGAKPGQAGQIAKAAGLDFQEVVPISPSHLDSHAQLSLAILSRYEIIDSRYVEFANPGLSATGPTGEHWILFDKGYLVTQVRLADTVLTVVNAHCFPLHYFGAKATDTQFDALWKSFGQDLAELADQGPVVAAIDLNYDPIEGVLGKVFDGDRYTNSISQTPTIPKGVQQDYLIFTRSSMRLVGTSVVPTDADHHYCQARFVF
jgi:endonuclease/exonuclease/phosphatase family metal-dependent hydrolase